MKAPKLKPCPFCGGEPELRDPGMFKWVSCRRCFAETFAFDNETIARAAWNRRPSKTARGRR